MPVTVSGQSYVFLYSVCGGMVIAFIYDIFRIKRKAVKTRNVFTYIEDFLFWVLVAAVMFAVLYYSNEGEIRGYIFIGTILGAILYILLLSKIVIHCALMVIRFVIRLCRLIWAVLSYPFKIIFRAIAVPARHISKILKAWCKRVRNISKNRAAKFSIRWKMFKNKIKKI